MAKLAPCLDQLRDEIDGRWPNRSKASDGWLGDASHSARKSDHNPDGRGIVHALDVTTPNTLAGRRIGRAIKKACVGDDRIWYVIWRGYIYSKTHGWRRRRYTGPNKHMTHIHISADYNRSDENNRRPFLVATIWSRLFGKLARR